MSILGKLFRHKRRAQGSVTVGPGYGTGGPSYRTTDYGTGGPSYRPTGYGTGGPSYGPSGPWYPSFGPTGEDT